MAIKFGILNAKGGVGKTATARALAGELSKNHNKTVLLIDCDLSANLTGSVAHADSPETPITSIITDWCEYGLDHDIMEAIVPTEFPRLDLVAVEESEMNRVDTLMDLKASQGEPVTTLFKELFPEIEDKYDYMIFDMGAAKLTKWSLNALSYCDYILTPVQPTKNSIIGFNTVLGTINSLRKLNRKLQMFGMFFVMFDKDNKKHVSAMENAQQLDDLYIPTPIRKSEEVENSDTCSTPPCYYKPKCNPSVDYAKLAEYIVEKIEGDVTVG